MYVIAMAMILSAGGQTTAWLYNLWYLITFLRIRHLKVIKIRKYNLLIWGFFAKCDPNGLQNRRNLKALTLSQP
jgi:hypothetical protein